MTEEIKQETPRAWATIKKSSSKDGGIGYEFGFSDPGGDTATIGQRLAALKVEVLKVVETLG